MLCGARVFCCWMYGCRFLFVAATNPHIVGYKKKLPFATTFFLENFICNLNLVEEE